MKASTTVARRRPTRARAMSLALVFMTTVAFVTAPAGPASAVNNYGYTGCKFSSTAIPYDTPVPPSGYYLSNAQADWQNNTDVSAWNKTTATVRIQFSYPDFPAQTWSGLTSWTCSGGKFNNTVTVQINRHFTDTYNANGKVSVMAHEIGHALGLIDFGSKTTSPCSQVVLMNGWDDNRFFTCGIYQTQLDDQTGINLLY